MIVKPAGATPPVFFVSTGMGRVAQAGIVTEITGRKRDRVWAVSDVMAELDDLDARIRFAMLQVRNSDQARRGEREVRDLAGELEHKRADEEKTPDFSGVSLGWGTWTRTKNN